MPTETVYGLAADATNADAVARIYEAKGRPSFNPADRPRSRSRRGRSRIGDFDKAALASGGRALAGTADTGRSVKGQSSRHCRDRHAPGLPTVGIRVPAHPAMQALLRAVGRPLAAPSANASGSISPTRAEHVLHSLGGRIRADPRWRTERARARIDHRRGDWRTASAASARADSGRRRDRAADGKIEAPGQLASHYAPAKPLRLNARQRRRATNI